MNTYQIIIPIACYFAVLFVISILTGRKQTQKGFFDGDRKSPWWVVSIGMVGTTISGVTFISIPGEVANSSFHYFQFILGNFVGYILIANFLLPYYYRKNVVSIYEVLEERLGATGSKTASAFFILSKTLGSAFRLFLAAGVLQIAIFNEFKVPFGLTVLFCLLIIWLYTFKSGIRTVIWTDMLQAILLISAALFAIVVLTQTLSVEYIISNFRANPQTAIFNFDWHSSNFFPKQFLAGIVMTLALNGFDQDIIQKNLTCTNSQNSRKNMMWFSGWFVVSVFLFLVLGYMLYQFAAVNGVELPVRSDDVFPHIAMNFLGMPFFIVFIIGILAASFSSADSALTSLTTVFFHDFARTKEKSNLQQKRVRNVIHLAFSLLIYCVIMLFHFLNNDSVVVAIFKAAGYTYGPIVGLFLFAFFSNRQLSPKKIIGTCLAAPILTFLLIVGIETIVPGFKFGFEIIIINSLLTIGLFYSMSNNCLIVKNH